ncbi:hypothetical protein KAM338_23570 [Aeromonas caviae]|uniref:hypothetical protein n=1 Tax=Aeromonas hydrophila TaxID=644 RepID=UPI001680D7E2|nr:hypothetical protein [Aeromonas hydrophila]BCK65743.1 hypothetical protein KAM330_47320 [Aeromonas hydrophila]GKQ62180.1 hypothetical protein KAM338_23570 [Aeromonas caviae]
MHKVQAVAATSIQPVLLACKAIVGVVSQAISQGTPPTRRQVGELQVQLAAMCVDAAASLSRELTPALLEALNSEIKRAQQDTSAALSYTQTERFPSLSSLQDRVEAELRVYAAEGIRILNAFVSQTAVNTSAGVQIARATVMARTSVNGRFSRWADGKVGIGHSVQHRVFLATAAVIQEAMVNAYIIEATRGGAAAFVIDRPGKEGDGRAFRPSSIPFDILHPQSGARVVAAR